MYISDKVTKHQNLYNIINLKYLNIIISLNIVIDYL